MSVQVSTVVGNNTVVCMPEDRSAGVLLCFQESRGIYAFAVVQETQLPDSMRTLFRSGQKAPQVFFGCTDWLYKFTELWTENQHVDLSDEDSSMLLDLVRSLKDQVSSLDMQNYEKRRTEYLKDGKVQQVVYLVPDHCLSELKASWSKILYDLLLGDTGTNGSKRARPGESKPPPALHAMHVSSVMR